MNIFIIATLIFNIPINEINFIGNKTIPSRDLLTEILSKKNAEYYDINLSFDSEKILQLYKNRGFFSTKVTPKVNMAEQTVDIVFSIDEGTRPKIKKISIHDSEDKNIKKLLHIKTNDYFIKEKIFETEKEIEDYYKDNGYPFANVSSSIKSDSGTLDFIIEKGNLYYIRTIEIKGLKSCKPIIVRREIELNTGDIFSKSKLYNSQKQIYCLGFFSTIDVEMLRQEPDTIDLIFTMRELKSGILNFGIGFSIPLSFLFSFGIEELNIFNIGHRFQIGPSFKIDVDGEWESKLEAKYTIPNLTPAKLDISLLPFYWLEDKVDFQRMTRGTEFRISKVYNENIQYNIAHKYKHVDFKPKVMVPDTCKGVTNSVRFQYMVDYRNKFFNPTKGVYLLPLIEYAGGIFMGDNDFLRFEVEERLFFTLLNNTVAQRLKLGVMIPIADGFEVYEKYYVGGQYSLRGYPEKSVGPDSIRKERYGNILVNLNIEYRIPLPINFGLVAFFDIAYVDNKVNLAHSDFLKSSAGFGIRYCTPIGPLRCDIGFPLAEKGREIYFGIYNIF